MTPSLPHDRSASTSPSPPQDATTSWSVGWALTAITLTVLVVGVAIIRQLSAGPESTETRTTSSVTDEALSSTSDAEQETSPPRLVLRPEEPDSALVPQQQNETPASLDLPKASEKGIALPAYR